MNGGVHGGSVHGSGTIQDVAGGRVQQPDEITADGTHIYRWRD